ncbi:hypothetical protein KKD52_05560 [Myxococcota bacterium]|nr:hypothetical protein [Myxococcota bacterium]MBU1509807.1 hypothetical protein [Myxococcota bacterium]
MNAEWIIIGIILGIGALVAGGVVMHLMRCRRARLRCALELPGLAEALGLTYTQSRTIGQIMGSVSGTYRGRQLEIDPDSGRHPLEISRRRDRVSPIDLDTRQPRLHPEPGWVVLPSFDPAFDKLFKKRYASAAFAEMLSARPELTEALSGFARRWGSRISHLGISGGSASFRLKIGALSDTWNEDMWQPVDELQAFIPDLVNLLELVEQHASEPAR